MTSLAGSMANFDRELQAAMRRGPEHAVLWLHEQHGSSLIRYLKRLTWGLLETQELRAVYEQLLQQVLSDLRAQTGLLTEPGRWVEKSCRAAAARALEASGYQVAENSRLEMLALEEDLCAGQLGQRWRKQMTAAQKMDFRRLLLDLVLALSFEERLLVRLFVETYTANPHQSLYETIAGRLGMPAESVAVKELRRLWRATRSRLANQLQHRGYILREVRHP